jgi:hypothetical protein
VPDGRRGLGARAARGVRAACTERLALKGTALLAAVALWLVARGEAPATAWVAVRVAPALDGGARLAAPAPAVRALVSGPARELLALGAEPPVVRRAVAAGAPDTVRLELEPADLELPPGAGRVRVRGFRPRAVTLRLARTTADAAAAR